MRMKKFMMSLLCLTAVSVSQVTYAMNPIIDASVVTPYTNEGYEAKTSLQPLGDGYSVQDILDWSPEKDSDARYNRSTIPLQQRYQGPVVNPNASTEAKIMNCALTYADTNNAPSQGSDSVNGYIFSYWQYIDSYVYWGSVDEGIFAIPTPDVVDAAHKNGVPVVATVFFPWGQYNREMIRAFCQQDENGNFPVADKMLEMAEFYGFDGYFINQESNGADAQDAKRLTEMFMYMQEKNPDLVLSWYDSMSSGGGISFMDQLYDGNSMYFQQGDREVMDEFFLNYNWSVTKANTSVATATKLGRSPFDVYAGLDVQQNAYNTNFRVRDLLDENGKLKLSLAMYCPNSTLSMAKDVEDFYKHDQKFWVGPTGDPAHTNTSERWVGLANYVADKTAINGAFVTNFNLGHGYKYFIDGTLMRDKEWSNRSVQEYLPTWRWTVESTGSKLAPDFDFTDAYNGGNSLKVTGNLQADAPNHIKLYSTNVAVTDNTDELELVYKAGESKAKMEVGLCFGESYENENFEFFEVEQADNSGWQKAVIDLSDYKGQTVKAISLRFSSEADVANYTINIGQIAMKDQAMSKKLAAPASITFDEIMLHHASKAELRMYWDSVKDNDLQYYEVYRVKPDGAKEFIGATPNNAYYIAPFERNGEETSFNFEVVPVDTNNKRGNAQSIEFVWELDANDTGKPSGIKPINLALNKPVTTSRENSGEPGYKAVDGEVANNSKWCATNARTGWLSIDLEEPKTVQRWVVTHAEAGGEAQNMNTIDFDLQVSYDGGTTYQNVDVVNGNRDAITDRILAEPVTAQHFRLNVRNSGSSPWGAIRIYEVELFEEPTRPETEPVLMHFGKAINEVGASDTVKFTNVPQGQTIMLYKTLEDTEPFATQVAGATGQVTFSNLDFGTEAGRVFYAVQEAGKAPSFKLSLGYDAEVGATTPIPERFTLTEYEAATYSAENYYGTLQIHDLKPGDVVNYYNSLDSITPIKSSIPVAEGSTTTKIERLQLNQQGGDIILEVQRKGMKPTPKFVAKYTADKQVATKGNIQIDVKNEEGAIIMGATYEILKEGKVVGEVITDHSGKGMSEGLDPGTYTLRFKEAPGQYAPDATEYTLVVAEPFQVATQEITLKQQGATLTLAEIGEVVAGKSFEVNVGVAYTEDKVYAQDFVVDFDADKLEFVGVKGIDPTMVVEKQVEEGSVRIILATEGGLEANQEAITLQFAPKREAGNSQATIAVTDASLGTVVASTSYVVEAEGASQTVQIKEAPPVIDKEELANTIKEAQALSEGATVGELPGHYPQAAKDALEGAIEAAQQVMATSEDQVQIDTATTTLRQAMESFKSSIIKGDQEDVNKDGKVNIQDLALVAYYYHVEAGSDNWEQAQKADINKDGKVDLVDLSLVASKILEK